MLDGHRQIEFARPAIGAFAAKTGAVSSVCRERDGHKVPCQRVDHHTAALNATNDISASMDIAAWLSCVEKNYTLRGIESCGVEATRRTEKLHPVYSSKMSNASRNAVRMTLEMALELTV